MTTTRFLELPDGRLAFEDVGEGALVLCLPGMGDLRREYRLLTPLLVKAGHRVVTVDVRGHGETDAVWPRYEPEDVGADAVALLRHLDAGPAVLIGESFAAASAVWAAAEAPDLVGALVLLGPFARQLSLTPVQRVGIWAVGRSPRLWGAYYRSLSKAAPPPDLAEHVAAVRANLAEPGRMGALRAMLRGSKAACEARIPEVAQPALVVMGTADPDFPDPSAEAEEVRRRLPDATVVLAEGAGHYPHVEQPRLVADAVLDLARRAAGVA